MSFQITPARSSRVTNSRRPSAGSSLLRRSSSSISSSLPRRKSSSTSTSKPKSTSKEDDDEFPLDDTGISASLASNLSFRDIPQYILYIRSQMFSSVPATGSGMNSTCTAEVLNYRKNLPPIVSIAHLAALSPSSTRMEREIVELAQKGIVRSVIIPGRGAGKGDVGDGLVMVEDWKGIVTQDDRLNGELKSKYTTLLTTNPTSPSIPGSAFTPTELSTLVSTGYLTTPTLTTTAQSSFFALQGVSSLATAGSRNAAGSLAAVGGTGATHYIHGGTLTSSSTTATTTTHYNFSLPNTGAYIKLLSSARSHLLSLLKKTKYHQLPMDVLRERWDGAVPNPSAPQTEKKKARGEFVGVVPGRTKKWRTFWGLRCEWVV